MAQENIFRCYGCENTLTTFIELTADDQNTLSYLYDHKVIPRRRMCPDCNSDMVLDESSHQFRCYKRKMTLDNHRRRVSKQCLKKVSQYQGTWFEKMNMPVKTNVRFVAYWALLPPPRQEILCNELGMSKATVVDWSNFLREICFNELCENPQPIGGPGKTVEIDEAKIGKRKYNRGRIIQGNWVFGGIDRDTNEMFIVPVATRGHATLLPIIRQYILPGTTIISDCWRTYQCLQYEGYQHLTVNHTYNFVDPETGANTNKIERVWREVRCKVPRFGNHKHHFHGHLAEFLFKRKHNVYKERLHAIWTLIAKHYQGPENDAVNDDSTSENESDSE